MPTYDYVCQACGHTLEHFQSISDKLLRTCPACGKRKLERQFGTGIGVVFKGSGFYETDYKRAGAGKSDGKQPGAQKRADSEATGKSEGASPGADPAESASKPASDAPSSDAPSKGDRGKQAHGDRPPGKGRGGQDGARDGAERRKPKADS